MRRARAELSFGTMRAVSLALLAVIAFVVAGCGGGGASSSSKAYANVENCLMNGARSAGLTESTNPEDFDLLSKQAGQGAVALTSDIQEIQVSVERTAGDAEATEKQYLLFADQFGSRDNVKRYGNIVVAYSKTPTESERTLIQNCVK